MTNKEVIKDNPNPYSREEKPGEKKPIKMIHLESPFDLFFYAIIICVCYFIFEFCFIKCKFWVEKKGKKVSILWKISVSKSKLTYKAKFFLVFLSTCLSMYCLAYLITSEFQTDFIIGVGSRTIWKNSLYVTEPKGFSEGSIDYFSVMAFQKGKDDFLHCFDTTARQAVSRLNYESINFQSVRKSFGFYDELSKGIYLCGTNLDDEYKCYLHNGHSTVGVSKIVLPSGAAIVKV